MQLGFVGPGKTGLDMVTPLARGGPEIVPFDRSPEAVKKAETAGASGVASLEAPVQALALQRAVLVMVPSGAPTQSTVASLGARLSAGDPIIRVV
jgi:6-phosphogluconate dehydrogenase